MNLPGAGDSGVPLPPGIRQPPMAFRRALELV
jgi:hypothetical protein